MKYKWHLSVCFLLLLCVISFFLISCDDEFIEFHGLHENDDYAWYLSLTLEDNKHYCILKPYSPYADDPPLWYYTDDGSDPIKYGEMYTTPILVDRTTIIKVVLKKKGAPVSNVREFDMSRRINTKLSPTIISSVYYYGNGESEFDGVITIDSSTFSVPVGTIINVERDTNTFYTLDGSVPEYGGEKFFGEITLNPPCTMTFKTFPTYFFQYESDPQTVELIPRLAKPVFSCESKSFSYDEIRPIVSISSPDDAYIAFNTNNLNTAFLLSGTRENYMQPIELGNTIFAIAAYCTGKEGYKDSLPVLMKYPIAGEAGGILVHDKGSYSNGWRYLEMAPSQVVKLSDNTVSVSSSNNILSTDKWTFPFGYSRSGKDYSVAEDASEREKTEALIDWIGEVAYLSTDAWHTETTEYYVAKVCVSLNYNGFDDWFFPSINFAEYIRPSTQLKTEFGYRIFMMWGTISNIPYPCEINNSQPYFVDIIPESKERDIYAFRTF